jgi:hypothetical protein
MKLFISLCLVALISREVQATGIQIPEPPSDYQLPVVKDAPKDAPLPKGALKDAPLPKDAPTVKDAPKLAPKDAPVTCNVCTSCLVLYFRYYVILSALCILLL